MKTCAECGDEKTLGHFLANESHKDGLMGSCRECESTRRRAYYRENVVRERATALRSYYRRKA